MVIGSFTNITPEQKLEWQAGYKEGYEAGRAAIRKELKALISTLKGKDLVEFSSSTSTSYLDI